MVEANPETDSETPQSIEAPRNRKIVEEAVNLTYTWAEDQYHELGKSNVSVYRALLYDNNYFDQHVALKIFEDPSNNPSMINEMLFAERQKHEREGLRIANDRIVQYIGWNTNALEMT